MHDLGYFREHLEEFEQMASNRGVKIDFAAFRALDQERRERITSTERLKAERNKASDRVKVVGFDLLDTTVQEVQKGNIQATIDQAPLIKEVQLYNLRVFVTRGNDTVTTLLTSTM